MPDDVRWIRSYVLDEGGGSVGTVCIYEASSPEAIRRHATLADLPVDEIVRVADTVIVRLIRSPRRHKRRSFEDDVYSRDLSDGRVDQRDLEAGHDRVAGAQTPTITPRPQAAP